MDIDKEKIIRLKDQDEQPHHPIWRRKGQENCLNMKEKLRDVKDKIRISSIHTIGVSEKKRKRGNIWRKKKDKGHGLPKRKENPYLDTLQWNFRILNIQRKC